MWEALAKILTFVICAAIIVIINVVTSLWSRKRFMKLFCNADSCRKRLMEMAKHLDELFREEVKRRQWCVDTSLDQDQDIELRGYKALIKKSKKDFWRAVGLAAIYYDVPQPSKYSDYLK